MSYQMALCARVIKTGQLMPVLDFGITADDFTIQTAKSLWGLLLSYYQQPESAGSVLHDETLKSWFKQYVLPDDMPHYTVETLCYEVRRERIITSANSAAVNFSSNLSIPTCNPLQALQELHTQVSGLIALGTNGDTDIGLRRGVNNILAKMELQRQGTNFSKMRWPWKPLQDATFGLQPDDYIVFYGRPKSMKTWVLVYLMAWAFENEKKILVYTKEMTPDNVYMRALACIQKIPYDDLRGGPLVMPPDDYERLMQFARMVQQDDYLSSLITVLSGQDVAAGGDTVSWLHSKIDKYQPDVMFVDGMYLLSDQKKSTVDHARVMNISRDLRAMNLATRVPVIATMQANRKAAGHSDANLDEIAYSDALAQDATIAARVINDKTSPTISIIIGGSREFKLHGFRIHADVARNFTFHSEMTEKDTQKAKEADAAEDVAAAKAKKDKEKKDKAEKAGIATAPKRTPQTEADILAKKQQQDYDRAMNSIVP